MVFTRRNKAMEVFAEPMEEEESKRRIVGRMSAKKEETNHNF